MADVIRPRAPREIIDRRALGEVISRRHEEAGGDLKALRAGLIEELKAAMATGREEIRRRFDASNDGAACVQETAYLIDQVVRILFDVATTQMFMRGVPSAAERLCVAAIGGYGRGELSPQSDIDLLFILPYKQNPYIEQVVEFMLYALWDLGLKVGHATRSVSENLTMAKSDLTIRTSLLEMRWIWGERDLFVDLATRLRKEVFEGSELAFVEAKLAERDARHARLGDSRYVLEPNIKEDKGGLRDLHTLYWLARYLYGVSDVNELAERRIISTDAARRFEKAQHFLWTVRCHIHYLTGRADNRLTFDLQREISVRMGYKQHAGTNAIERFMKHYYLTAKDVGDLTRIFCAVFEEQHKRKPILRFPISFKGRGVKGFDVVQGRLSAETPDAFQKEPIKLLEIFRTAQQTGLEIHPNTLRLITENVRGVVPLRRRKSANAVFMDVLTAREDPEPTLRLMNEADVLGRFIPDFGRVVAQMQFNMYHVYTTDEHTIRAVGILHRIETGELVDELPIASEVVGKIQSRRALYVATFLHDIAKGRKGDHSVLGAEVALKVGPRLGLTPEETETVSWLVLYHLAMSNTAFKRDLNDPKTIADFADLVQSPERLKLLLVLTCADIRAVGPGIWNEWKATLLRELYRRTLEFLAGEEDAESVTTRRIRRQQDLAERLSDFSKADLERHFARDAGGYWLAHDLDTLERHARFLKQADAAGEPLAVSFAPEVYGDATEMLIYTQDHPGLFAAIAGVLALSEVTIVGAKIHTFSDGMVLDSLSVQGMDRKAITAPQKFDRIRQRLADVLTGKVSLAQAFDAGNFGAAYRKTAQFDVPPRVIIDNSASRYWTVVEINGLDQPGFLYRILRVLVDLGLQISTARIMTYGERVVDVFYVKDLFGMKIDSPGKVEQIREALLTALEKTRPQKPKVQKSKSDKPKPDKSKPANPKKAGTRGGQTKTPSGDPGGSKRAQAR